jgi:Protein involved in formate dehydrogenase formation
VSAVAASLRAVGSPFTARRRRADALRARHPFADEVLTVYLALLPAQEEAWAAVRERPPGPDELPRWVAAHVLPAVVDATLAAGPRALREAVGVRPAGANHEALVGWLQGAELDPIARYLARASLAPVLEALGDRAGAACAPVCDGEVSSRCPRCGGLPQLSCLASSGETLVSGPRSLLCARCGFGWSCSRSVCPACGESEDAQLSVYAERLQGPVVSGNGDRDRDDGPVFPHLRIAACATCSRYLIEVDLARDARAVPEVDELAAIPLDLYAADQGLTKITPNLMGF